MSQEGDQMTTPVELDDTTVVIQGRVDPECIAHYASRYGPSCIVSTWEGDDVDPLGMRMVKSLKPSDPGPQNSHFQLVSTLAGLRECRTGMVIKVRGDEYFSNLEYIVEEMKKTMKILTLPIFFRPHSVIPFHPSDHLLAGLRQRLLMMYRSALAHRGLRRWNEIPEQLLGAAYLEAAEGTQCITKEHMLKHFDILDLERVKDYRISWNVAGRKFYNNFDPKVDGAPGITSMQEL
jgi:hypothetical protein